MTKIYSSFQGTAWPTISLFLTISILHLFSLDVEKYNNFSYKRLWFLALHVFCCYAQFTVMHDASHGAISTTHNYLNDIFGWLAQLWMGPTSNFYAFRHNHKQHHKYTNDPEKDPDHWTSQGRFMLLRWLIIDTSYWYFYIPQVLFKSKRPRKEVIIVWTYHLSMLLFLYFSYCYGFLGFLWWNWILPARLSKFFLAFFFDYLPHYPHKITQQQDKYHTTRYIHFSPFFRPIANLLLFYQNYHISHHLMPSEPFFRNITHFYFHEKNLYEKKIFVKTIL